MVNLSFENKTALVTGASSGIGLATAQAFTDAGAAVVLSDVNEDELRAVTADLVAAGHQALSICCDVSDEAEVAAMVEQTVDRFGRLDVAFNNAGIMIPAGETVDASGEDFERVIAVNLRGVWNCMKYELRQMREQGSGAIVNNSSIAALGNDTQGRFVHTMNRIPGAWIRGKDTNLECVRWRHLGAWQAIKSTNSFLRVLARCLSWAS